MAKRLRRVLRKKQLTEVTGYKDTALDDMIARGEFPKPIPLGPRAIGWLEDEIITWQEARIADREREATKVTK